MSEILEKAYRNELIRHCRNVNSSKKPLKCVFWQQLKLPEFRYRLIFL